MTDSNHDELSLRLERSEEESEGHATTSEVDTEAIGKAADETDEGADEEDRDDRSDEVLERD